MTPPSQSMSVPRKVEAQRRGVKQAVDAVEHAAVTSDERTHVLYPDVPLYDTDRQIAEVPADADNQACKNTFERREVRHGEAHCEREQGRDQNCAERTFARFPGAHVCAQQPAAKKLPAGERGNVVEFDGKEEVEQ